MAVKNQNNAKISVYLVNYNYGKYIERAIESVLKQSYQNFELIIIDDGSTDNSRQLIEKYAKNEKILVIFQENKGLNRTNNVALDNASGEYIVRLDADDFLEEHALEVMSKKLDRTPEAGLVFPDYFLVDEEGNVLEMVQRHNFDEVTLLDQPAHGACTMIRRECLRSLEGYDESYHCQDGWDLWVRFIQRYGVANINLPLFYYRQHPQSLTKNEKKILSTRSKIFEKTASNKIDNLDCIAVIPVKGSVIDPKSMALHTLGDKTVIDWTIDEALASKRITKVVVTSPSDEVIEHVNSKYNKKVYCIKRDWKLALHNVSLDETLTSVFDEFHDKWNFDAIALLFGESPFKKAVQIDAAIDAMQVFETNRVLSVRHHTGVMYRHSGKGLHPLKQNKLLRKESEELFNPAGGIMVIRRGYLYRDTDKDSRIGHIEVDEAAAFRIDSKFRWEIAQLYAEKALKDEHKNKQDLKKVELIA